MAPPRPRSCHIAGFDDGKKQRHDAKEHDAHDSPQDAAAQRTYQRKRGTRHPGARENTLPRLQKGTGAAARQLHVPRTNRRRAARRGIWCLGNRTAGLAPPALQELTIRAGASKTLLMGRIT